MFGIKPSDQQTPTSSSEGGIFKLKLFAFKNKNENLFRTLVKKIIISEDNKFYMYWRILPAVSSIVSSILALYNAAYRTETSGWDFKEYNAFDFLELTVEAIFCLDLILPFFREIKDGEG